MQIWFTQNLKTKYCNYFFPMSARKISKEMEYFFNIPCITKIGKSETKQINIKLYEIPQQKYLIVKPEILIINASKKISELANSAPAPIRQELINLQKLVNKCLEESDRQLAAKNIAEELGIVEKTIARQIEIEDFLLKIETESIPPGIRLKSEFEADRKNPAIPSKELREYLDSVEKQFQE